MQVKKSIRNIIILLILVASIGLDQYSKSIVRQKLDYNTQIEVVGQYMVLTKIENTGAFLGMGDEMPRIYYKILMIFLPILVLGIGLFYMFFKNKFTLTTTVGVTLVIAGGLGNIYDRILYGSVTDFLQFDFILFRTGIVNLADISVTAGVFVILIELLLAKKNKAPMTNK